MYINDDNLPVNREDPIIPIWVSVHLFPDLFFASLAISKLEIEGQEV